ncbi:MAG: hypothetical protein IPG96_21430 [Proteobacteria bacterium]|nr:hypothetical protein [Pseudomonadota bacterium]
MVLLAAVLPATACGGPAVVTDFAPLQSDAAAYEQQRLEVHGTLAWCWGDSIAVLVDAAGNRVAVVDEDAIVSGAEVETLYSNAASVVPQDEVPWPIPGEGQRVSAVGVYSGRGLVARASPELSLVPILVVDRIDLEPCREAPPAGA